MHPAAVVKNRPMDPLMWVKVWILVGRPRLPSYMLVPSFFPACIVSVSSRYI